MSNETNGGPAFPVVETQEPYGTRVSPGMSLLDYFAGQALIGLLASERYDGGGTMLTHDAYKMAGYMIDERKKRSSKRK